MLIWNGTQYARIGGNIITTEDPIFAKRDEWRKLQHKWIDAPLDLDAPFETRCRQLAESEDYYTAAASFERMNNL
jgi:hypothetical protein